MTRTDYVAILRHTENRTLENFDLAQIRDDAEDLDQELFEEIPHLECGEGENLTINDFYLLDEMFLRISWTHNQVVKLQEQLKDVEQWLRYAVHDVNRLFHIAKIELEIDSTRQIMALNNKMEVAI